MKLLSLSCLLSLTILLALPNLSRAEEANLGAPAPDFELSDLSGQKRHLSDFKGKIVVLEWFNSGCPFVKKHYNSKNMQKLQKEATDQGVVWLTITSSAEGRQGYASPQEHLETVKNFDAHPTAFLPDPLGTVGKLYGAKTTPHMFVIDSKGVLAYEGAIDDKASDDVNDIPTAKNYVTEAIKELQSGGKVSVPTTTSYGCSVKYAK